MGKVIFFSSFHRTFLNKISTCIYFYISEHLGQILQINITNTSTTNNPNSNHTLTSIQIFQSILFGCPQETSAHKLSRFRDIKYIGLMPKRIIKYFPLAPSLGINDRHSYCSIRRMSSLTIGKSSCS
ncbi:hypothetical protein D3C77_384490 [compost metagenome]